MKYYNNNSAYGDAGPHEAKSVEALADEMADLFDRWAWEKINDPDYDYAGTSREHEEVVAEMRVEFIAGLEEV